MASREGFLPPITAHRDRVLAVSDTFPYDTEHLWLYIFLPKPQPSDHRAP